jgi:predicted dehydrogenase
VTPVWTTKADTAEVGARAYGAEFDLRRATAKMRLHPDRRIAVVVHRPSHYSTTKAAQEKGKHVYCEWPLGGTVLPDRGHPG